MIGASSSPPLGLGCSADSGEESSGCCLSFVAIVGDVLLDDTTLAFLGLMINLPLEPRTVCFEVGLSTCCSVSMITTAEADVSSEYSSDDCVSCLEAWLFLSAVVIIFFF